MQSVRGKTFNLKKAIAINFSIVHAMVTNKTAGNLITVVDTNKIARSAEKCCVITKPKSKDNKIVFDKTCY